MAWRDVDEALLEPVPLPPEDPWAPTTPMPAWPARSDED
jgi:hypothetical protein